MTPTLGLERLRYMRNYWLNLVTATTWDEFLRAGADVSGFLESKWTTVREIKPGDHFLCYMIGISRFIAVLEMTPAPFKVKDEFGKTNCFLQSEGESSCYAYAGNRGPGQ